MVFLLKELTLKLTVLFLFVFSNVFSQSDYARIDKNRNPQAEGFFHDLNKTKDTLILKSDRKINYLYSIDKNQQQDLNLLVDAKTYKLPLNKLRKGKHVFVVIQSPLRIVFVVHVLEEIPIVTKREVEIPDYVDTEEELTSSKHN